MACGAWRGARQPARSCVAAMTHAALGDELSPERHHFARLRLGLSSFLFGRHAQKGVPSVALPSVIDRIRLSSDLFVVTSYDDRAWEADISIAVLLPTS